MSDLPELEVMFDQALAPFTTFGIGGPADVLYLPKEVRDLMCIFRIHQAYGQEPVFLGGGSNVLVSDEGVAEPVVVMKHGFDRIEVREAGQREVLIKAGAGVATAALVSRAESRGWADLVFLSGIPGTLGGAAMMNAGWGERALADVIIDNSGTWEATEKQVRELYATWSSAG